MARDTVTVPREVLANAVFELKNLLAMCEGLTGAKPEAVCHWAFELAAARPDDELHDLFPGTGAVTAAWKTWQGKFTLPSMEAAE